MTDVGLDEIKERIEGPLPISINPSSENADKRDKAGTLVSRYRESLHFEHCHVRHHLRHIFILKHLQVDMVEDRREAGWIKINSPRSFP